MASISFTESSRPSLILNASNEIGVAFLDLSRQKTHAVTEVIFSKSFTKASLYYTKDHIQYGWPKEITSSSSLNPIYPFEEIPGTSSDWVTICYSSNTSISPECHSKTMNYFKELRASVQKVKIIFDSEKTYENSLLKQTVASACKDFFPNLKSYSLVFPSV